MPAFRAAIWKQNHWFIAQCVEIDLATQGGSEREALENIREALALHLDLPAESVDVVQDRVWLKALRSIDPARLAQSEAAPAPNDHAPQFTGNLPETTFLDLRYKLEANGFDGISQRPHHAKFIKTDPAGEQITAILPHYTELSGYVAANILRQARLHN